MSTTCHSCLYSAIKCNAKTTLHKVQNKIYYVQALNSVQKKLNKRNWSKYFTNTFNNVKQLGKSVSDAKGSSDII